MKVLSASLGFTVCFFWTLLLVKLDGLGFSWLGLWDPSWDVETSWLFTFIVYITVFAYISWALFIQQTIVETLSLDVYAAWRDHVSDQFKLTSVCEVMCTKWNRADTFCSTSGFSLRFLLLCNVRASHVQGDTRGICGRWPHRAEHGSAPRHLSFVCSGSFERALLHQRTERTKAVSNAERSLHCQVDSCLVGGRWTHKNIKFY